MKELYYDFGRMWGVYIDEPTGRHYIEVECGGAGLYPVKIELTSEEVEAFKKDKESLANLASKIAYSPDTVKKERGVSA